MTAERQTREWTPAPFASGSGPGGLTLSRASPLQFTKVWERSEETGRLVRREIQVNELSDAQLESSPDVEAHLNEVEHGGLDEPGDYTGRPDLVVQAKFNDGQSGPKSVKPANASKSYKLTFDRKDGGTIYFDQPKDNPDGWSSANHKHVNIKKGSKGGRDYGETLGGKDEYIDTNDRPQHFSMADKKAGIKPADRTAKWTWHHLKTPTYDMALVDMAVHRAFGHNGGVHLWPKN
ncbi:HNH endonuclease [Gimibacter soli]|uniref:HNH endonuclease n=1 Tax=Gimibacter soli TaxID=3024400 RepID=A0AAF0BLS2_9PROT|nr:HNH endonuclease [Gimibacter soli]WCL53461.1 HNH endonuclease [Gimibacter soli]